MFITIKSPSEHLSWLLCKHPDSTFDRTERNQQIIGKWLSPTEYQVTVHNDTRNFMSTLKSLNYDHYVSEQFEGAYPYNLNGIFNCLRTVISKTGYTEEFMSVVLTPIPIQIKIGPIAIPKNILKETFEAYGLTIVFENEMEYAYTISIETIDRLYITLQKVFILLTALTLKKRLFIFNKFNLEKYIKLSSEWIEATENKIIQRKMISKLSNYNKAFVKDFVEDFEDKEVSIALRIDFVSLHQKRLDHIANMVSEIQHDEKISVVDYGCGECKLLKRLDKIKNLQLFGFDASDWQVRYHRAARQMNLLVPNLKLLPEKPDILILSEVIEHFSEHDGDKLLYIIRTFIQPQKIIITTPNILANNNLGVPEGELRHNGHKIEFKPDQFDKLMKTMKNYVYEYQFMNMNGEITEDTEYTENHPTIICILTKIENIVEIKDGFSTYYENIYFPLSNITIGKKILSNGYCQKPFMTNHKNIFYLQPTISPVDSLPEHSDFLEHPQSAFNYYADRGITTLYGEQKYMGSNAQILIFKDAIKASQLGYSKISINSRSGYPFFKEQEILDSIYDEMQPSMINDFYLFNCEILPWTLKGYDLIKEKFKAPGEIYYIGRKIKGKNLDNVNLYLKSLENFIQKTPLEIRIFDLLVCGNVDRNHLRDITMGVHIDREKMYPIIDQFDNKIVKSVERTKIDLNNSTKDYEIESWLEYCNNGGEGKVYKPGLGFQFLKNGYLLQPALKVRGRDYLRIIYGIDYLTDYFSLLVKRNTKMKRMQAIQEHEMAQLILRSFVNQLNREKDKYIASFLGCEQINFSNLDKTL